MRRRLGCLSPSGIASAGITLLVIVLLLIFGGGSLFSPGPLSERSGEIPRNGVRSHAEIDGECSACHPGPVNGGSMSERCLVCHVEVARELEDATSFHGTLLAEESEFACQACHTEHRGADATLTVVDPLRFPHQATGYSLAGHRQAADGAPFACPDCHGKDLARFDPDTCQNCHGNLDAAYMQAHIGSFGTDCLVCHDGLDTYGIEFDHSRLAFPLLGIHALQPCQACHAGARSPSDLRAVSGDCFTCHQADDAHEGRFGQDCGECHAPESWAQATFDHDQIGFLLEGRHAGTACRGCHVDGIFAGTDRECYACHQATDVHEGVLGVSCDQCHTPEDWSQVLVDHDRFAFQLVGRHQRVDCVDCHPEGRFRGMPVDCFSCHQQADAHDGQYGTLCGQCHSPQGWEQVTLDHNQTGFPLTGVHTQVSCRQCHTGGVFQGTSSDCVACHGEPSLHVGLFGIDCASCHNTSGWQPAAYDRPHAFPLNHGTDGPSSCGECHAGSLLSYHCFSCHDPGIVTEEHDEKGITDIANCVQCHPTGEKD